MEINSWGEVRYLCSNTLTKSGVKHLRELAVEVVNSNGSKTVDFTETRKYNSSYGSDNYCNLFCQILRTERTKSSLNQQKDQFTQRECFLGNQILMLKKQ